MSPGERGLISTTAYCLSWLRQGDQNHPTPALKRESASRERPPASHPQVNQASRWGFDPVDATIADHRGLRTQTGHTRSGRCRRRSPIMKVATFPLAGHSGRRSLVVIGIELRCQQSVRPPREGGGFGIEVRALCFDQQLGRHCNLSFPIVCPRIRIGPRKHIPTNGSFCATQPHLHPHATPNRVTPSRISVFPSWNARQGLKALSNRSLQNAQGGA